MNTWRHWKYNNHCNVKKSLDLIKKLLECVKINKSIQNYIHQETVIIYHWPVTNIGVWEHLRLFASEDVCYSWMATVLWCEKQKKKKTMLSSPKQSQLSRKQPSLLTSPFKWTQTELSQLLLKSSESVEHTTSLEMYAVTPHDADRRPWNGSLVCVRGPEHVAARHREQPGTP